MATIMSNMSDAELIKIGLVAMALLHHRVEDDGPGQPS